MTPVQFRMARAALRLDVEQLGREAGVPAEAVAALEAGEDSPAAAAKLRASFEADGIEFLDHDGVRLTADTRRKATALPVEQLNAENDE